MSIRKHISLFVLLAIIQTSAVQGQSLKSALIPDADLLLQVKLDEISKSTIFKFLQEMKGKNEELASQGPAAAGIEQITAVTELLRTTTGLEPADFLTVIASFDLDAVDLENPMNPDQMRGLVALLLAKELPIEKLEALIKALAAEHSDTAKGTPDITQTTYKGTPILRIKHPNEKTANCVAIGTGNKILLFGPEDILNGAVERHHARKTITPAQLFSAQVGGEVGNCSVCLLANQTDAIATKIKPPAQDGMPPNPVGSLTEKLKTVGIGINFGETIDLAIVTQFTDSGAAQQASTMVDNQLINGIKAFASMMASGAPLPALATMKTKAGNRGTAWFRMSISKADIDTLATMAAQQASEAAGMTEMPMDMMMEE